jgi:hypothetical protein
MALPRPLLVALVGVVLAAAAFYATQSIGAPTSDPAASSDAASAGSGTAPGSTGAAAKPAARPAPETDELPRRVQRALAADKVIVLLFTQPGAADDDATNWASRALKSRRVAVFRDRISDIGDYKKIVAGVGVAQAPATVVVDEDRKARVLEGYTDRGTLRQVVRDALR